MEITHGYERCSLCFLIALFLIYGETKILDDPYSLHFIPKGLLINRNISFLAQE